MLGEKKTRTLREALDSSESMELRCWTQGAQEAYGVQEAQEVQDAQKTQDAHGHITRKCLMRIIWAEVWTQVDS